MSAWQKPSPSGLTRPFWEAAKSRTLVRPQCTRCGANFFTPQLACPRCLSEAWSWAPSTGEGVIHSAVVVHRPPDPGIEVPYVLAIVLLNEGWNMLTNIVGCDPAEARVGKRVRVNWDRQVGEFTIPTFELVCGAVNS